MNDNRELDRLDEVRLAAGAHLSWQRGACLMEAVAFVAGEKHSDHPACTSPVLGAFGRGLNDVLPDDLRQQLKPLVPLLIGSAGDGHDKARSYLALDWLIRTWLPTWLELGGFDEHAAALRALVPLVDQKTAATAGPVVRAAGAAAWAAAGAAARAAVGDAASCATQAGVDLPPTVRELQLSAIDLFSRMITVGAASEAPAPTALLVEETS